MLVVLLLGIWGRRPLDAMYTRWLYSVVIGIWVRPLLDAT